MPSGRLAFFHFGNYILTHIVSDVKQKMRQGEYFFPPVIVRGDFLIIRLIKVHRKEGFIRVEGAYRKFLSLIQVVHDAGDYVPDVRELLIVIPDDLLFKVVIIAGLA